MALLQPKVQEIAKDLKLTSTEIIEALTEMGYTVKNSSVQLDDEQLGIIFDIFTKMYDIISFVDLIYIFSGYSAVW